MKRVLFITRKAGSAPGGMETMTRELVSAFQQLDDVQIKVVAHRGSTLLLPFFCLRALCAASMTGAGTVHLGDALLSPIFLVLRVIRPSVRRTVTVNGLDITWRFPLYRMFIRWGLQSADRIVALSRWTAGEAAALGVDPQKITIIPCGISPVPYVSHVRNRSQLLLLQRLVPRKGAVWFLKEVWPLLSARRPDLQLVIAGDGPDRQAIASIIHSPQIRFVGKVSEGEKDRLLRESGLLIVPNILRTGDGEGFGMVCLEAGVRGLPVVASRLEGLQDAVIENVTGLFFEPSSPESAVSVILAALDKIWDEAAIRRTVLEHFNTRTIALRYLHDIF